MHRIKRRAPKKDGGLPIAEHVNEQEMDAIWRRQTLPPGSAEASLRRLSPAQRALKLKSQFSRLCLPAYTNSYGEKRKPSMNLVFAALGYVISIGNEEAGLVIAEDVASGAPSGKDPRNMVIKHWPNIRDWLHCILANIDECAYLMEDEETSASIPLCKCLIHVILCAFISTLCQDDLIRATIYGDVPTQRLIVLIWVLQGKDPIETPPRYTIWGARIVAQVMEDLLKHFGKGIPHELITTNAYLAYSPYSAVEVSLGRLRSASKQLSEDEALERIDISAFIASRVLTIIDTDKIVLQEVLQSNGVTIVVKSLRRILDHFVDLRNTPPHLDEPIGKTLFFLGTLLHHFFLNTRSDRILHIALKCGILCVLGDYISLLTTRAPQSKFKNRIYYTGGLRAAKQILEYMVHHTVYAGIVVRLAEGMDEMERRGEWIRLMGAQSMGIGELWQKLRQLAVERTVCKAMRDRAIGMKVSTCDGCDKRFENADLKKCSLCRSVKYCSQRCQAAAWRLPGGGGHKFVCAVESKQKRVNEGMFREVKFIICLAKADIRRHRTGIIEQIRTLNAATSTNPHPSPTLGDLSNICIEVDYTHTSREPVIAALPIAQTRVVQRFDNCTINLARVARDMTRKGGVFGIVRHWYGGAQEVFFAMSKENLCAASRRCEQKGSVDVLDDTIPIPASSSPSPHSFPRSLHPLRSCARSTDASTPLAAEPDEVDACLEVLAGVVKVEPELQFFAVVKRALDILEERWDDAYKHELYSTWR